MNVPAVGGLALAVLAAGATQAASAAGLAGAAPVVKPVTVYVADQGAGTVTPISARTWKPGKAIKVGNSPGAIAITPDGRTAYVVNGGR